MMSNFALIIEVLPVALFFGFIGWAFACDSHAEGHRVTVGLWIAVTAALGLSSYALIASHWPWVACSLGIFAVVNMTTALILGRRKDGVEANVDR
jgi:hypothetical protein